MPENRPGDLLQAPGFRLKDAPQEILPWRYRYLNRPFPLPDYRNWEGTPLTGWDCRVVPTRRFFTDKSARVYYRPEDLRRSYVFEPQHQTSSAMLRIWPVDTILVLETFAGNAAFMSAAVPVAVDCMRKFGQDANHFSVNILLAGEWCYQSFSATGRAKHLPKGAVACHQCHSTTFHHTGDLVFTVFSGDGWQPEPGR